MATANHVLLRRITLSASAASVTFDSIPQTGYTDLKIVVSCATSRAADEDGLGVKLNSSTTGYTYRVLTGDGASTGSINTPYGQLWAARIQGANAGSNIFSSTEIYIPNYAGSTAKSYMVDSVTEKNGTNGYMTMAALVQTSTSAISSIELSGLNANFIAGSSFSLYGIADVNTTPALAPKADGGDIIRTDGTYWYHAFLSTGIFKPQLNLTCDALVIAGGGGGGYDAAGGGGAGGVIYKTAITAASATNEAIVVGAGATGATTYSMNATGSNSTAFGMTAFGGGGGGTGYETGFNGGSGGGGGWGKAAGTATQTSNNGGTGYGNSGGNGGTNNYPGGGGGGAGAAAANCTTNAGTPGGAGLNTWSSWATATGTGVSGYYAGGGGGGAVDGSYGTGGAGGGGNGSQGGSSVAEIAGSDAVANTGSGGGGGASNISPSRQAGYNGGSGIVIIRYPV